MKYGKYEYERSFLVTNEVRNQTPIAIKKIEDKYIEGTGLRLRKLTSKQETIYELTQKEKVVPDKRGILKINTLYLTKSSLSEVKFTFTFF